ncbi:MAG: hypothetical protein HY862_17990 [Chloroflexi bacterium]|nr:hypothetical protein [Chloroflexota bacterium]
MWKTLRWPLLALLFAVILLVAALYTQLANDKTTNEPSNATPVSVLPPVTTPSPQAVEPTAIPTVEVAPGETLPKPVPGQLTEALVGRISKINPLYTEFNPVDRDIASLIYEGLTTIDQYGEVVPDLAERWEVSKDGLEYIFALRRDILWQDGIQFTSADVHYTIDAIRDPDFQGNQSLTEFWKTVEVSVIDDYTMRFRLVQPLASFPEQLRMGILPFHVLQGYPIKDLDKHPINLVNPIGTGPYQLESLLSVPGKGQIDGISLRVAPTYRQRPEGQTGYAIDRIVFYTYDTVDQAIAAYVQGEVNSIGQIDPNRLASLRGLPHLAVYNTTLPSVGVLIYNWNKDGIRYVRDQRLRQAFAYGIDRIGAVQRTMGIEAIPANSPLIPGSWAYDPNAAYPSPDVNAAQALIDTVSFEAPSTPEATPTEGGTEPTPENGPTDETPTATPEPSATPDPIRRNFTILVLDDPAMTALAQDLATQWAALGFTVTVEAVDHPTLRQRLEDGDFDTAIVEFSFAPYADPDPYTFWHVGQAEDGQNYGAMRDLRLSELLQQARRETVGVNRVALYKEFQRLFVERAPALTLYYPVYSYVTDDRLENVQVGFITTPADRFRTLQDWTWAAEQ